MQASSHVPGALKIGHWLFLVLPDEWEIIPETGVRRSVAGVPIGSVSVIEEQLPEGMSFQEYVESQLVLMQHHLPEPVIQGPAEITLANVGLGQELGVRYACDDGQTALQVQIYVNSGAVVGVVTFTTTEKHLTEVRKEFELIRKNLMFLQREPEGIEVERA